MNGLTDSIRSLYRARREAGERQDALSRLSQCAPSKTEYAVYAVLPLLYVMAGAMPTAAIFVIPVILIVLVLLYRRFGIYLPLATLAGYGIGALVLNYDILSVVYLCFLICAFSGLVLSIQLKPYLLCAVVAAMISVLGGGLGLGVVRLAENAPLTDIAANYITEERDDPIIDYFARTEYEHAEIPESERMSADDPEYKTAYIEYFADLPEKEYKGYAPYYCIHFGAVFGIAAYFFALILGARTQSAFDAEIPTEDQLKNSTRALGGMRRETTAVSDMRVPRLYLAVILLPAFLASCLIDYVGGLPALGATFMHAFITVPTAFACCTLLAYFVTLFKGRARIAARIVLGIAAAAIVIFPIALFAVSIVGLCDVILNLRYWIGFLSK